MPGLNVTEDFAYKLESPQAGAFPGPPPFTPNAAANRQICLSKNGH